MSIKVIKVGGSLFDWPELGPRLSAWLDSFRKVAIFLVPGGGPTADAIRRYDSVHGLGEEASHWLALRSLSVNAHFLAHLLPGVELINDLRVVAPGRVHVLDMFEFARGDEANSGRLPPCWDVTSDSLALRVAQVVAADELILLKSTDTPPSVDWEQASRQGLVDPFFCRLLEKLPPDFRVTSYNMRTFHPKGPS